MTQRSLRGAVSHHVAPYLPTYAARQPAESYPQLEQPTIAGLDLPWVRWRMPLSREPNRFTYWRVCRGRKAPLALVRLVGWTRAGARPTFDVVPVAASGGLVGRVRLFGPKLRLQLPKTIH